MLLIIDNYDSFTYNLVDYFQQLGCQVKVIKNDELSLIKLKQLKPQALVISPGPGSPINAGISLAAIGHFAGKIPILGICLGHQAIGHYFGASIIKARAPVHGKLALIQHDNQTFFNQLPQPLSVVRYHSLFIDKKNLPECLTISAMTTDGCIMAVRHKTLAIEGLQFHPEAILTEHGLKLLKQFLLHYQILPEYSL
ncbi:MAG: aminodeoxychorismate/anthranilate synthase component II [Candidatus Schmidhempelia sp.]|nr:aminodeoxychorismate/anthranilate synthase component II [Candidatus Schmidhempelia sp.]